MVWELSPDSTMREQFLRLGAYVKLVHVLRWNEKKSRSFNALNHHGGGGVFMEEATILHPLQPTFILCFSEYKKLCICNIASGHR